MRACVMVLASCATRAPRLEASHPATTTAPIGKLAGAPPALRPGAASYPDVPPLRTAPAPEHHHPTP
ncbi:MAG: hypothetical protein ABI867_27125 [Kofleriaceae bacterium]